MEAVHRSGGLCDSLHRIGGEGHITKSGVMLERNLSSPTPTSSGEGVAWRGGYVDGSFLADYFDPLISGDGDRWVIFTGFMERSG